ncbi:MAG: hypothetical protein R3C01_02075 [Planctomycetaceae bacterium]
MTRSALPPRASRKTSRTKQSSESRREESNGGSQAKEIFVGIISYFWPYLVAVFVVGVIVAFGLSWSRSKRDEQAVAERLYVVDSSGLGPALGQATEIRGKLMIVERVYSSAHLETGGYGPPSISDIQSELPAELRATSSDPIVTYVLVTKAMDLKGDTYVEKNPDRPDSKPKSVTGGVRKRATVVLYYWENGKLRIVGNKKLETQTPDEVHSQFATTMAPSLDPVIRDWLLSLPRK